MFITLEGGEGAGKTTQIKMLASYLEKKGREVVTTREPGGTESAELIRGILLGGSVDRWDAMSELLLFFAARRDHVERKIKPALAEGKVVLSDRFADSSLVIQVYASETIKIEDFRDIYRVVLGDFKPNLTLILDIPVEAGFARVNARGAEGINRMELKGSEYHSNIYKGLHKLAKDEPDRCKLVNANRTVEEVHTDIIRIVDYAVNA